MSGRTAAFLVLTLTLLLIALSTGTTAYYLLFLTMLFTLLAALVSAVSALWLVRAQVIVPKTQVVRGDNVSVRVLVRRRNLLPIGQVELKMAFSGAGALGWMSVSLPPMREREYRYSVACPHRGQYEVGISALRVTDVFGLFTLRRRLRQGGGEVTVLPRVDREGEPLAIEPGENGPQARIRMTEDTSSPAGVRAWQEGDELKKVHWKRSMRKRELMVRTYEDSARPDTLILMDLSPVSATASQIATLEDAMCETAGEAAFAQLRAGYPIRMPLNNQDPTELAAQFPAQFETVLNRLAFVRFDCPYSFEQILSLETRRMQRTGGVVLVTTRLSSQAADFALRMRRQGLAASVYWVSSASAEEPQELLAQLNTQGVLTRQVNPWQ